jgi:peptidyl-dipeptidase Dcp
MQSRAEFFHVITDEAVLGEMPQDDKDVAQEEAKKRKLEGWVFTLSPPSYIVVMKYCTDRSVRQIFFQANCTAATSGKHDNRPLILRLLKLRKETATLLGYRTYADYVLADRMARNPQTALKLLRSFGKRCRAKARVQLAQVRAYAKLKDLQWWDLSFYGRQMREEYFKLSDHVLQQYFPLESIVQGAFDVASALFGLTFTPLHLPDAAMHAYEVIREGKRIGYFVLDPYARQQKRDGAWCDSLRVPIVVSGPNREYPVALNVSNAPHPAGSKPSLLRHMDVQTIFHEFGHALHLLLSDTPYRNIHSFQTEWDFVELPSQLYENWCWEEKVLRRSAKQYKTSEPIPKKYITQLRKSRQFLQAIGSLTQVEFAMLDMALHTSTPPKTVKQLDRFCARVTSKYSLLANGASAQRYASFHHLFGGGYAAGYYSYLWADILQADVFSQFAAKGIFDKKLGEKLRKEILAAGTSRPGAASFRAFMGRGPKPTALLRQLGLL